MAWTTFANLTVPTLPQLDGNFSLLSYVINITCTVAGTNSLTMTSQVGATTYTQYQLGMRLQGVAVATNSGPTLAQLGALPLLPIYKDAGSGPTALAGGEIVNLTAFSLLYDPALNSGGGGWHLQNSANALNGFSLSSLNVGLLGAASLNAGTFALAQTVFGTVTATVGAITNLTASVGSLGSLAIGTGAPLLRLNSTLTSLVYNATLTPATSADVSVSWSGVQPFDNVLLGFSTAPTASLIYSAWSPAAGTVTVRAFNPTATNTVTVATIANIRLTDVGWT